MPISAYEYHQQTSYDRHEMGGHRLDWVNQPSVFKTYSGLHTISLHGPMETKKDSLYDVICKSPAAGITDEMTLEKLSQIIHLAHTVTAKARHGHREFYYRNVASAGALYPFELYIAVQNVTGIDEGLYHHTLAQGGLTPLRQGNIIPIVLDALYGIQNSSIQLIFFLTSIFFRSSWKYRDRAYRYALLDTGHLAENLSLALKFYDLSFRFFYDYHDRSIDTLLNIDGKRESCLAVICVSGKVDSPSQKKQSPVVADAHLKEASQVSARETDYRLIQHIHASSLKVVERISEAPDMANYLGLSTESPAPVSLKKQCSETKSYSEVVFKRRSKRNFVPEKLPGRDLEKLLELVCSPCDEGGGQHTLHRNTISVGLLAGHVEGLESGFYLVSSQDRSISLVSKGFKMARMAHICLDQAWLANSALHFVFLSNLEILENAWGPRGYRYAMLTAGRLGQRIYLGATTLGLGCCGIGAFYDIEAARLLGVNEATRTLYLVAVGPIKK